jgi:peptidyl-prolyl cis-trans isomerase SurA
MYVWLLLIASAIACQAEIIDRIAVTVGTSVITESEIMREIRLTAFLNGEPLNFSAEAKRKAADRLVEQRLIQIENESSLYPAPTPESVDELLKQAQARFHDSARYQEELRRTGVTEEEVKAHLRRQLTVLRFLDLRFRPGIQVSEEEIQSYFDKRLAPQLKKANPAAEVSLDDYREEVEEALIGDRVDKASDTWLREARDHTRIDFRANVFPQGASSREASAPSKGAKPRATNPETEPKEIER